MTVTAEEKRRIIGIAGHDIEAGDTILVSLSNGPNQLIWKDDGREIAIQLHSTTCIEDGDDSKP